MMMDLGDFMDPFHEEFHNYFSPASNSLPSSSTANDNYSKFSTFHNTGNQLISLQQMINRDDANYEEGPPTKKKGVRKTYGHLTSTAERWLRGQLSQLFVALSALIPGLNRMDKGSGQEGVIKYVKHLQERVKTLEEKAQRKAMESAVVVKKSRIVVDDHDGSSSAAAGGFEEEALPEIRALVRDGSMLVKVLCEKRKESLAKLISKVESLGMIIVSSNSTPLADVAFDITIVAEMEKEFNLTVEEVEAELRAALAPGA